MSYLKLLPQNNDQGSRKPQVSARGRYMRSCDPWTIEDEVASMEREIATQVGLRVAEE